MVIEIPQTRTVLGRTSLIKWSANVPRKPQEPLLTEKQTILPAGRLTDFKIDSTVFLDFHFLSLIAGGPLRIAYLGTNNSSPFTARRPDGSEQSASRRIRNLLRVLPIIAQESGSKKSCQKRCELLRF